MTLWLSAGLMFTFAAIVLILYKWWDMQCIGETPVRTLTFIAILFTSGLDVGLIMFPLTEFGGYADTAASPEYGFANPLAIEFGFWAFLIWGFYFLTCFYFAIIEPRVKFFEIPLVKLINNVVIIGTCAFTAYLLLVNLPWYLPQLGDGETVVPAFYVIVFASIGLAVYSSSKIKFVRVLSLGSSFLFIALIVGMWVRAFVLGKGSPGDFLGTAGMLGEYFTHLDQFVLPINDYHEFYLFWWFSWSIMIGQFTARFVSGIRTWQLLIAMLVIPSIAIGTWFSVLYYYHAEGLKIAAFTNIAMISVGVLMVVNSLDSLIRLYTDNLNLTAQRLGRANYVVFNFLAMVGLTMLFQLDFLQIQWVGALVIALYFACFGYILLKKRREVAAIESSPKDNILDFHKIELVS
ncbi:MAG: BCCT family transporter [Gammaproteobacteria bacterium]|uniref:Choline transporter BetT, short form n=1 Tax=Marinobacter nitratireducens TaxID=1137280 RepID=A0A072N7D7_9GAMM|nr:choline transporter [Marinobacter nitratireducens]KEF33142.1 Choline transporter BetT, short form [Marinobacter nitratireducens]TNE72879.1 MAG: BCCT family transporter [Gammaproteobacteria bacterium]TNE96220.1 MAG: BCCT family transporter [Gammaproteobacteria bacterium]